MNDNRRRLSQIITTIAYNAYLTGFLSGTLYQGFLKHLPCPGLNCYSCPAAVMSCPIGSLQLFIAYGRMHFSWYIVGCLGAIGSVAGRIACGWACPFGFLQDLLYKIPSKKLKLPTWLNPLRYIVLCGVIGIVALITQEPWFCKVCPAGTIEAGITMVALNTELREQIGTFFIIKLCLLLLFCIWMVLCKRPFCRVFCPLGTLYALFNRVSMLSITVDDTACTRCSACLKSCPMDLTVYEGGPKSSQCIRCFRCTHCPSGAIRVQWFK